LNHQDRSLIINRPGFEFSQRRLDEPLAVRWVHQEQVEYLAPLIKNPDGPADVRVENLRGHVHPAHQKVFVNNAERVFSLFDKNDPLGPSAQGLTSQVSCPREEVQDKLPGDIASETVKDRALDPIRRGSDSPAGRCYQSFSLRRSADDTHQQTINPKSEYRSTKRMLIPSGEKDNILGPSVLNFEIRICFGFRISCFEFHCMFNLQKCALSPPSADPVI